MQATRSALQATRSALRRLATSQLPAKTGKQVRQMSGAVSHEEVRFILLLKPSVLIIYCQWLCLAISQPPSRSGL